LVRVEFESISWIRGAPRFFNQLQQPTNTPPKSGRIWDWIAAPTGKSPNSLSRSNSTSHGGFSGDDDTGEAILERLEARRNTPTLSELAPGRSRQMDDLDQKNQSARRH
jgi:hypothetical protein